MKEQLVSIETARLAKEKGFSEICTHTYSFNSKSKMYGKIVEYTFGCDYSTISRFNILIPTQTILQKWLRERHRIHIWVDAGAEDNTDVNSKIKYQAVVVSFNDNEDDDNVWVETYEEALESGLQLALTLIN